MTMMLFMVTIIQRKFNFMRFSNIAGIYNLYQFDTTIKSEKIFTVIIGYDFAAVFRKESFSN